MEALVRGPGEKLDAVEHHLARALRDEAHQRAQRGRLAGAVAAHQRDDLAAPHVEVDALHDMAAVVPRVEPGHPQDDVVVHRPSPR